LLKEIVIARCIFAAAGQQCEMKLPRLSAVVLACACGVVAFGQVPDGGGGTPNPVAREKMDPNLTQPARLPAGWTPGTVVGNLGLTTKAAAAAAAADAAMPADAPAVPREFRGVWVATVANIDWPSKRELSVAQQQAEITTILDNAVKCNLNAIILQVRPTCDAIYPSALEPWSEFVTGVQGRPPSPMYDPLAMWIEGAHQRGMELHAWFNPFRARHIRTLGPDAASHVVNAKANLVRKHNGYMWMDPGEQGSQDHSMAVIMDVVKRYDVDGVHFDDYFYPYPKDGEPFPDGPVYAEYQHTGGKLDLASWRRENIDRFMKRVHEEVKAAKPFVKIGISPFGIWRPGNPPGIKGFDAFEKLHADSRKWLAEGWCDYMSPQLYWRRDAKEQAFEPLLRWWISQNTRNRQIWPGIYTSRLGQKPAAASIANGGAGGSRSFDAAEIIGQVELTRTVIDGLASGGVGVVHGANSVLRPGVIHFSAIALLENREGIADKLRAGPYAKPALVPQTAPVGTAVPGAPQATIVSTIASAASTTVRWVAAAAGPGQVISNGPTTVQVRTKAGVWTTYIAPAAARSLTVEGAREGIEAVVVQTSTRDGVLSRPAVAR